MIVIISMESAPKSLIGIVSQYFIQVDRSLFVSQTTVRVVDLMIKIISENIGDGRAVIMTSNNSPLGLSITEIRLNNISPYNCNLSDIIS